MRIIGIDAETHYDTASKYSLSSMGAEEYIRHPKFQEIGWSYQVREEGVRTAPAPWFDARNYDQMHDALVALEMHKPSTVVVAHNGAAFDFMMLSWLHGILPWRVVDTLQMSRWLYGKEGPGGKGNSLKRLAEHFGIGEKGEEVIYANGKRLSDFSAVELAQYGRYCSNDTVLTLDIFEQLALRFRPIDFTTMHLLAQMSSDARIKINREVVEAGLIEERERKGMMLETLANKIGTTPDKLKSAVMSNQKFATVLEALGYEPPMKESKTTGKPTYAFAKTDPEMQEWADSEDELLANVVRLRTGIKSTIMEARMERYIAMSKRGAAPAALRWQGTVTGRANADGGIHKLQFHNTPKRANARNPLRLSIESTKGWWYAADSGQIEVRVNAVLAGEDALLRTMRRAGKARDAELAAHFAGDEEAAKQHKALVEAADMYLGLGPTLFGRRITKADKFERNVNKAAVLAAGFGQGWRGFQAHCKRNGIDLTDELAERTIDAYRQQHTAIVKFWRQCRKALKALVGETDTTTIGVNHNITVSKGIIVLPSGRELYYPKAKLRYSDDREEDVFSYQDRFTGKWKYLWHGVLVENCVAGSATVLTDKGFKPLEFVRDDDLVWDGVEFVSHGGLVKRGEQETINLGGTRMTPDHEVKVGEEWVEAKDVDYSSARRKLE